MGRIISFDEYLEKEYHRRLQDVKKNMELTSLNEARTLGLSLDEYVEHIKAIQSLVGKDSRVTFDDFPVWVKNRTRLYREGREENVRYNNLNVSRIGFIPLFFDSGNYGLVIVGNQEDFRDKVEADLKADPAINKTYEIGEATEIKNVLVANFDDGDSIRSDGVQTAFNRQLERTATIYKELKGLHWSEVTREQSVERVYQDRINPAVVFYVRHMNCDPDNWVIIAAHGNEVGVADVVRTFADYVKANGFLAHFQAGIKPYRNWPGVLYDPRTSR